MAPEHHRRLLGFCITLATVAGLAEPQMLARQILLTIDSAVAIAIAIAIAIAALMVAGNEANSAITA